MIQTISSILLLYSWIVVAILVLALFLIGRFYERQFGQKAYYKLFLVPLVLFLVASIWYTFFAQDSSSASLHDFVGKLGPDLLFMIAGIVLIVLCHSLHRMMMGDKK